MLPYQQKSQALKTHQTGKETAQKTMENDKTYFCHVLATILALVARVCAALLPAGSPLLNSLNTIVKLTLLGIHSHKISHCIVSLWKGCSLALYFGIFIVYIKLRVNLLLWIPHFGQADALGPHTTPHLDPTINYAVQQPPSSLWRHFLGAA